MSDVAENGVSEGCSLNKLNLAVPYMMLTCTKVQILLFLPLMKNSQVDKASDSNQTIYSILNLDRINFLLHYKKCILLKWTAVKKVYRTA